LTLLRLAWRNLGRNRRRTGLTTAAGAFAAFLTLISLAMARGSHDRWIEQVVRLYPGHLEVSLDGYREYRTLDYSMSLGADADRGLDALPGIDGWAPRLESWALAVQDADDATGRAAWLVGIDAARELRVSTLLHSVSQGRFVEASGRREVVLGEELASSLDVELGERIILIAPDYYGSQSADRFEVVGTLAVGDREFDGYAVLLDLRELQEFLEVGDGISHVAVFTSEPQDLDPVSEGLGELFSADDYEVLTWLELIPDVVQFMVLDDIGAWLTLGVLIVVVGFGLLNTLLMAVFERVRELGVMRAVGLRPRAIFSLVMMESLLLSLLGIAIGLGLAIPPLLWLEQHPIPMWGSYTEMMEFFEFEPLIVFDLTRTQLVATPLILMGVAWLAALPPALRAARIRPVDALWEP
jgi:ABC-type lipoprotein release transport system permease subunit